jgi:hypothetical protein
MSGDDVTKGSENAHEEPNLPSTAPKKLWYRRKWITGILLIVTAVLVLTVLKVRQEMQYMFHRPIEVTRGPWQVLDPGQPVEPLKFEVVEEGNGPVIEPGDLIQVSLWYWSNKDNQLERRDIDRWIWVGFRSNEETLFHTIKFDRDGPVNLRLVSAFVGLKEKGGVRFLESPVKIIQTGNAYIIKNDGTRVKLEPPSESIYAGNIYCYPFGNRSQCGKKSGAEPKLIFVSSSTGYTVVHIKKVFKGQLRYRTTHLYDGTWYHTCYNFLECEFRNNPREGWYDDARYDGVSADGQVATFQYGPVETPGKITQGGMRGWPGEEWKKLPVGVQVK